jgi:hypothetical protein
MEAKPIKPGDSVLRSSFTNNVNDSTLKREEKAPEPSDKFETMTEGEAAKGVRKKWLIMNYVAADCNLLDYQLGNIDHMERVGSDKNTHIVTLVDVGPLKAPMPLGEKQGENGVEPGDWSGARTLYITKDDTKKWIKSDVIGEHGDKVDMSDPETLKNFVINTMKEYPAQHTALIFNDHGGGHTGAMADDTDGNFMPIPGMKQALAEAQEVTGEKIDVIGFDACVMAQLEVAHSLKDQADILLASQENEKGHGWSYEKVYRNKNSSEDFEEIPFDKAPSDEVPFDGMLGGFTIGEAIKKFQENEIYKIDVTPRQFAATIVDINAEHNDVIPTFSATDLTKIDGLTEKVDKLAEKIIKSDDKETIRKAIEEAENYGGGWQPYRDMRDLGHLCNNIIDTTTDDQVKEAAKNVRKELKEAVFANQVNPYEHPKSEGLSIYAPTMDDFGPEYADIDFVKETQWDEAILSLGVNYNPRKEEPIVWPDGSRRRKKVMPQKTEDKA